MGRNSLGQTIVTLKRLFRPGIHEDFYTDHRRSDLIGNVGQIKSAFEKSRRAAAQNGSEKTNGVARFRPQRKNHLSAGAIRARRH